MEIATATQTTFPTKHDLEKLRNAAPAEVAAIWRASLEVDRDRHCCARHATDAGWPTEGETFWMEAVYGRMCDLGLPTEFIARDDMSCTECSGKLEWRFGEYDNKWLTCPSCRTRQRGGDHMDCRLGAPEPVPAEW